MIQIEINSFLVKIIKFNVGKIVGTLPDESCRKCGGMLLDYALCANCKAPVEFICRICAHKTIERPHEDSCFRIDESEIASKKMWMYHAMKN